MRTRSLAPLILTGVLALAGAPDCARAQSWQTQSVSRSYRGENLLRVNVEFGAGTLRLSPGASRALYRAELHYDQEQFEPTAHFDGGTNSLHLGLARTDRSDPEYDTESGQYLDLELSPSVPLDLHLKFGAATAELELGGLALERAEIQTGASSTLVSFAAPNRMACERIEFAVGAAQLTVMQLGNARCKVIEFAGGAGKMTLDFTGDWDSGLHPTAEIAVGLGTLTLRLPRDLGVTVDLDRLFAGFESAGFSKQGDEYRSLDYESARNRLHLNITAALGTINVEWVDSGR